MSEGRVLHSWPTVQSERHSSVRAAVLNPELMKLWQMRLLNIQMRLLRLLNFRKKKKCTRYADMQIYKWLIYAESPRTVVWSEIKPASMCRMKERERENTAAMCFLFALLVGERRANAATAPAAELHTVPACSQSVPIWPKFYSLVSGWNNYRLSKPSFCSKTGWQISNVALSC